MSNDTPDFQNRERYVPLGNGWYYDLECLSNIYVTIEAISDKVEESLDKTLKKD